MLKETGAKYINLTEKNKQYLLSNNDLLVARTGTFGKTLLFKSQQPSVFASYLIKIELDNSKILNDYYWHFAQSKEYWRQANALVSGSSQPQFNGAALKNIKIPIPSLQVQEKISAQMQEEQDIIKANKRLIEIMQTRIDKVIKRVFYKTAS